MSSSEDESDIENFTSSDESDEESDGLDDEEMSSEVSDDSEKMEISDFEMMVYLVLHFLLHQQVVYSCNI